MNQKATITTWKQTHFLRFQNNPEPLTCTLWLCVVGTNQSVTVKPIDKVLIRKIQFGKKDIRSHPIKFDPRAPDLRTCDETIFKKLCKNLQNCLPLSSFFLFNNIKFKSDNRQIDPQEVPQKLSSMA